MLTSAFDRDGRFTVPQNRWDLLADRDVAPAEVSVVIPYYENQRGLEFVLAGLVRQRHPRSKLQVVIADDGSAQAPSIPEFARVLAPLVCRQEDRGFRAAAARNLGARHADGEVLIFLDGDTVPEPEYVPRLSRLPALAPDALVGGRRRHADLTGWTPEALGEWFAGQRGGPPEITEPAWLLAEYQRTSDLLRIGPRSYQHLIGAVLGCHRDLFDEIAGYDETMVGYGGEDYDFTYRAQTSGALIAHVPAAVAWHDGPEWAGRSSDEEGKRRQKNRETLELAKRVPEPSLRGTGQRYTVPDVVVEMDVTHWDLAAAVLCVRSVLEVADSLVHLTGGSDVVEAFSEDLRVVATPPSAAIVQRARAMLRLLSPVRVNASFAAVLAELHARDLGRITVHDGAEVVAELTSARATRRSARWQLPIEDLFPDTALTAGQAGVTRIAANCSLAAVFGGWGTVTGNAG